LRYIFFLKNKKYLEAGMDENKKREEEKGFVVKDKRFSATKEEEQPTKTKEESPKAEAKKEEPSRAEMPLPEINFSNLIFSLSTSALIQMGEIKDPNIEEEKNLPLAKQTIDLIGMLKEKTKGNLTPDEEKLMEHVVYDLKMRFVKASG
jgi:hypothetical protein